jgi:hypothetical protein
MKMTEHAPNVHQAMFRASFLAAIQVEWCDEFTCLEYYIGREKFNRCMNLQLLGNCWCGDTGLLACLQ